MSGGAPGPRGDEDQAALDLLASWQDTEEAGNAESGSSAPEPEETPKSVILQNPAQLLSRGREKGMMDVRWRRINQGSLPFPLQATKRAFCPIFLRKEKTEKKRTSRVLCGNFVGTTVPM